MLKECGMDPNETTQKLLLQDTFHEVRRKRDKKKENSRELADSRRRSGMMGRGGRSARGGYPSRFLSNDTGGGRINSVGKESGVTQGTNKGNASSSSLPTPNAENKISTSISSSTVVAVNGPTKADQSISPQECTKQVSGAADVTVSEESSVGEINGAGSSSISVDAKSVSAPSQPFVPSVSISGVYASSSDPVLVPSVDARAPGAAGAIKRQVGSQRMVVETTANKVMSRVVVGSQPLSLSGKVSPQLSNTCVHGKIQSKPQLVEGNQLYDSSHCVPSSSATASAASRPSSNYSNRSQQSSGSQKVGTNKEWKPKSTHVSAAQPSATHGTSNVTPFPVHAVDRSQSASSSMTSDITTSKLEKKLEDLQLSETQHVIIPHHLQVPESEKHGLSFGSFDASFKLGTCLVSGTAIEDISTPPSELSQEVEENVEEVSSSIHNESPTAHEVYSPDHPHTPTQIPENLSSGEADIPTRVPPEFDQSKPDVSSAPEGSQYSVVQTIPTYSTFGLVPQMLSSQLAPFESSEPQPRDATRVPSFVVQQPFDPSTSYYTQLYRPSLDGEGRFSPFLAPSPATKYNGNIAVLPAHIGLSAQETGIPLVLSSSGPTPLVSQAAGVMQSSITATQPVPVFRQPAGVHISHFPPNYIPYNQYFPQYYVPPPALHHFLSNAAFPQHPPTGSIYPPSAAGAPVKYPISQYKPGSNTVNTNHVGMPTYGTYNSNPAVYGSIPASTGGNSTGPDDLAGSQYKENNVYITGQQQSEGSGVWIPATGRDISVMPVNSFYGLSPQAQHLAFTPGQPGHGVRGGMYHPAQTLAAAGVHPLLQQSQAMAGAVEGPAGPYQQPQRAQMNWANNY